jgi:PAS domain S-box-containing protein
MTRVLIVDDREESLYLLLTLLRGSGYEVETACQGAEALDKALRNPPQLIVSDLLMPVMDGYTLLRQWRAEARLKAIPFVVYTATYTEPKDEQLALRLGADAFILKPAEPDEFVARLRQVLARASAGGVAAPIGEAATAPGRIPVAAPQEEEARYLREYSEVLIHKLEDKMEELERANRQLERDLAERKRAENQIRAQAELLDLAQDAIAVRGIDGCVQYWNKACERLTGWSAAEAIGKSAVDLVHIAPSVFDAANRRLMEEGCWMGELKLTTKAGHAFTVMSRWTLVRDEEGRPKSVLIISTDISEQKKLEEQFLRAQRLEGIGALASGIAHDLNNILAPVMMALPLLREAVHDAESRALMDTMEACTQRAADVIKQLLAFARGKPGARIPLRIRHLLNEMSKIIRETFPRNIIPTVAAPEEVWPLLADATQLHQVLMNLCVNARDAMPDGGTLSLGARNVKVDEASAAAKTQVRPGAYVCLTVSDTGTGIAPENLNRVFDPFFTTKEFGKGTGLGLATVMGIVRGHAGFIRVDSKLGCGTTFELFFPASPEAPDETANGYGAPLPHANAEVILVVDDEEAVRHVVQMTLETQGYRVLTASQGAEGLRLFSLHRAKIRAVLTDMMMPDMSGPAMISALKGMDPQLIIVGITGLLEQAGVKGIEDLNIPILAKPFSSYELLRLLRHVLHPPEILGTPKGPK